jgi:DNA mismatch repair protein MutL
VTEIRELDAATVERIAAGEVVERPASVVKELVENSLDAGADRIDVRVDGRGTERIVVADDGHGMSEADLRAAVRPHTTSKIRDLADLDAVGTLGFRGEALHTIGAVSRLTLTSRPEEGRASELRVEGGEVQGVGPAGRAPGTTATVEDLFFNTPAREKYLKTDPTEFGHVNRVVTRYALANPDVAVTLEHDDSEVFSTTGRGDLREAMLAVYGREVADAMVAVEAAPAGLDRVRGYVSDPEVTRSTREYLSTFVNGRYVSEPALREATVGAYGKQLAPDRFPFAVLFVELPGEAVDVNVHPRKMEVRFDDEAAVRDGVESAVEEALLDAGLIRQSAPRGRSAPDDTTIDPDATEDDDTPSGRPSAASTVDTARADTPTGSGDAGDATPSGESATGADDVAADGRARSEGGADKTGPTTVEPGDATEGEPDTESASREAAADPTQARESDADAGDDATTQRRFRPATENARLTDDGTECREFDRLPAMRVLGQFRDTYVVAETDAGLVLVDQHAADERVAYERLAERLAERPESQRLVRPAELELTAGEAAVFDAAVGDLRDLGFEAERDEQTVQVTAVPAVLADHLDPELVRDVLAGFLTDEDGDVERAADALLADMACHPALTGNTALSEGALHELLAALDDCENPYACPHGRPVVVELDETELAERFERDYPGHRTRRPEE